LVISRFIIKKYKQLPFHAISLPKFFRLDLTGQFHVTADDVGRLHNRQNHNKEKFLGGIAQKSILRRLTLKPSTSGRDGHAHSAKAAIP
jgi:hypothetical protein